jgi:ribosomal protein L39E
MARAIKHNTTAPSTITMVTSGFIVYFLLFNK